MIYGLKNKKSPLMDIKAEVLEIIDELFMEDVSIMMDEDLFDAGVLDSVGWNEYLLKTSIKNVDKCSLIYLTIKLSIKQILHYHSPQVIYSSYLYNINLSDRNGLEHHEAEKYVCYRPLR